MKKKEGRNERKRWKEGMKKTDGRNEKDGWNGRGVRREID